MDLQNDELAVRILEVAKKFDETAYAKPWKNLKKQRPVADLHYGYEKDPGMKYRSEIRCAKKKIYWYIGIHTSMYSKYRDVIDRHDERSWKDKWKDETRIIFSSEEEFFSFVNECLDSNQQ